MVYLNVNELTVYCPVLGKQASIFAEQRCSYGNVSYYLLHKTVFSGSFVRTNGLHCTAVRDGGWESSCSGLPFLGDQ